MRKSIKIFLGIMVILASLLLTSCVKNYSVTLEPEENFRVEGNLNLNKMIKGFKVTFTVIVPEGKEVDEFTVDGEVKDLENLRYTLVIVKNHKLKVTFKDIVDNRQTFSLNLGEGLSANVDNISKIKEGTNVLITIDIPEGQELDELIIDGKAISGFTGNTYVLEVTKNHVVTAIFKNLTDRGEYTVSLGSGLSSGDLLTGLTVGSHVTVIVAIPPGQEIDEFFVDGRKAAVPTGNIYVLTVSKNHSLQVTFKDITDSDKYYVSLGDGLTSNDRLNGLSVGSRLTILVNVPLGKEIDQFLIDGDEVEVYPNNTYVLVVSSNHVVSVTFRDIPGQERYSVSLGDGLSSTDPLTELAPGTRVQVRINIPQGKEIDQLVVDGVVVTTPTGRTYTITVSKNHVVSVAFKDIGAPSKYSVSLGSGLSSISPLTGLSAGTKVTVNINVPPGKEINQLIVDGVAVATPSGNTYVLTVSKNHVLSVTFKDVVNQVMMVTFKLNGGTLAGLDEVQAINKGSTVREPSGIPVKEGHEFIEWRLYGVKYNFSTPVTENIILVAHYRADKYLVTFYVGSEQVYNEDIDHGSLLEPYPLEPREGMKGFWLYNGLVYDFSRPVTSPLELQAHYQAEFDITQRLTYGNEDIVITFSEDVIFGADINDKQAFLESLFIAPIDYSRVNFETVTITYENLRLTIAVGEDFYFHDYFQVLDYDEGNGNGIVRIPLIIRKDSIKTRDKNLIYQSDLSDYVLKLYVPFAENQADYTAPIQSLFYSTFAASYDSYSDPVLEHDVTFTCTETGYEKVIKVKHGQKVNRPEEPEKNNAIFVNWLVNGEKFDFNQEIRSNINLTPRWADAESMVKISFDTQSPLYIEPQVIVRGGIPTMPDVMELEGYNFLGWKLSSREIEFYDFKSALHSNFELVAVWEKILIPVTINLNGGQGETEVMWPYGDSFSALDVLFNMENPPTKPGYLFGGFKQLFDDEIYLYEPITLDVIWLEGNTTITFNYMYNNRVERVNIANDIVYMVLMQFGDINEILYNPPERPGYIFGGWYSDEDYQVPFIVNDKKAFSSNYYAKWILDDKEPIRKYNILFETNGGNHIDDVEVEVGKYLDIYEYIPTKEGYKFDGWYVDRDLKLPYYPHEPYYYDHPWTTLYAKWVEDDTSLGELVTISFVTNCPVEFEPIQVLKGQPISFDEILAIYLYTLSLRQEHKDYTMVGWFDSSYEHELDLFADVVFESDTTLYALWKKCIAISGYLGDKLVFKEYLKSPERLSEVNLPNFVLDKYNLYLDQSCTNKLLGSNAYESLVSEDLTIYLKEKDIIDIPHIEYNIILGDGNVLKINSRYHAPLDEGFLENIGYGYIYKKRMMDGFYTDEAFNIPITVKNYLDYVEDGKLNLYVKWKDVDYIKVVTNTTDINLFGNLDTIVIEPGDTMDDLNEKFDNLDMSKEGYRFDGAYLDPGFTQSGLDVENVDDLIGQTVYVKWEKLKRVVVRVDTNGIFRHHKIVITDSAPDLEYEGYRIIAISETPDFSSEIDFGNHNLHEGQVIYVKLAKVYNVTIYKNDTEIWREYEMIEGDVIRDLDKYSLPPRQEGDQMITGWTLNGNNFDISQPLTADVTDCELKPIWGPVEYLTVQFMVDGTIKEDYTQSDVLPGTRFVDRTYGLRQAPYKSGHTFVYWYTEDGKEFTNYHYIDNNLILYALYVSNDDKVVVSYSTGVDRVVIPSEELRRYQTIYQLSNYDKFKLTKSGYRFEGWVYENGSRVSYSDRITENTEISAYWVPCETYHVSIGFNLGLESKSLFIPKNERIYISFDLLIEYGFFENQQSYKARSFKINGEDVTNSYYTVTHITGIFVELYEVGPAKITFMNGNETYDVDTTTYDKQEPFGYLPQLDNTENDVFVCWLFNGEPVDVDTIVVGDMILYAKFEPKEYITVSFITNVTGIEIEPFQVLKYSTLGDEQPRPLTSGWSKFKYWAKEGETSRFNFYTEKITEPITLVAVWEDMPTYQLTIDLGAGHAPVFMYFPQNSTVPLYELENYYDLNPNLDYEFISYTYMGETMYYHSITMDRDITIQANWRDRTKVTITFKIDNTEHATITNMPKNTCINDNATINMPEDPTREGYKFLGWFTAAEVKFDANYVVTESIEVYADWEEENTATVTFMGANGTHATLKIMKNTCISDHPDLSLPSNPARDLYNFLGWETSSHDTFDENYVVTESMTIYPKWDYTLAKITFETHDGTYTTVDITKNTSINDNPEVQFPDNPTRENYKFLGWETANHDAFNEYSIAATSMTVYARWEYMLATVTFKNYETTITTFNITKYTSISEHPDLSLPEDPVRDGHKFLGWKTEDDEVFDANYKVNKSIIVSAAWGDMTPVTITFMTEEGEHATRTIPGYTSINENSQNGIEMPSNPYKADHYFRCWRTVDDVRFTKDTIVTESITVNAYWSGEYNVRLNFLIDNFLHYWIEMQNDARITDYGNLSLPSAPDREFEKFVGWKTADGKPFDDYTIVAASTRIYAQYEPKEVATISFNTGITGFEINDMLVVKNIALGDKKPRLISRQNHMFLGWFTAGNVPVNEDYVVTEDITIYAKWKEATTFTLTVKLGDGYGSVPIYFPVNSRVYFNRLEKYYELNPNLYYQFNSYTCKDTSGLYNHYFTIEEDLEAIADWTDKTPDPVTITFMFYEDYYAKITLPRNTSVSDNWWNYWPISPYQQYYEHRGWKTSGGDSFNEDSVVTEDITVYAEMEQTHFPITFMNQGEVYCVDYMPKGQCYYDWHYGEHFPADPPAPQYHTFLGWYNADGVRFTNGTIVNEAWIVYAKWQDNTPAFVTFIDRGTEHDVLEVPKGTAIKNNPGMTLPETPSQDGYRFLGWFTADNVPFDTHYVVMESMTLYASWGDMSPVTLTFNVDGGFYASIDVPGYTSINENSGAGISMPSNPSKDGHRFLCWRTEDDVMFTKDTRVTGPMIINARWSGTNFVAINFVINNYYIRWFEIYGNSRITDYTDRSIPTESELYSYQRRQFHQHTGWEFADGTPFNEYTVVNETITVFAKYEPLETATISFVTNRDGFTMNDMIAVKNEPLGDKYQPITKQNHKFLGWYTIDDQEITAEYIVTGDITLYAKWEEKETHTITVHLREGYDSVEMYFPKGEKLVFSTLRDHYDLNPNRYYHIDRLDLHGYGNVIAMYTNNLNQDCEITANFTDNTPAMITYMVDDVYYSSFIVRVNKKIRNYDRKYIRIPERAGYVFKGWKTSSGDPFDDYTVVTADITVYAYWEPETP